MMSESDEAPPRSSRTCPALHVTGGPPPLVQVDQPIIIPSYLVMVWALLFVSCPRGPVTKPDRVAARNGPETRDDDFDVLQDGGVVGRIMKAAAAPEGTP